MMWHAKHSKPMDLPTSWQQLPNGQDYCNALSQYFANWLPNILGYQVLKIGGLSGEILLDLPMRHQLIISPKISNNLTALCDQSDISMVQSKITELPLIEKSIDACFLINTLNFTEDPHQVLREINRVITDSGLLFISLFNPINPLYKPIFAYSSPYKFKLRRYLTCRVIDWLELLNFEILGCEKLSISSHRKATWFAPLIVIVAQKRTCPLTLQPAKIHFKQTGMFTPEAAFKEINQ
ncbi:class I SAM-dependent methyltransferase [Mannheimia massilioguelmaensis]|uniref:class I SAM-dependent methyltransferase n=1 Tax=Mannheimia massilioguelmaensis TaxID=1604354 RepID=UPI0005C96D22|nr:class I SAM-dependent methyltransferase [Mannheimia massilioguelmaensis]